MRNKYKYNKGWWFCIILCPPVIFLLISWIVMLLWNCLLPEILGVKTIGFWQAMGILVLSKILFGGFHGKFGQGMKQIRAKHFEHRMEGMSAEEKEKFKEIWKQRCSGGFFNKNND
ncbi:hypothetical protein [Chryseobacterium oryzae]|uniref:Uncharacterized protein n=1 Tax=Chryseobacterium oryzae TaxID=2929799 RepID=A0ABY4BFN7_9FLAO|nr:hypothetical protein [Chryseobacterium oryzae]UOE37082.1 hypothetical protein MTP08_08350 [Chryseobacterium oryzae]